MRDKAAKSYEKQQAILEKARADIANFYKERALKREKSEAANRYVFNCTFKYLGNGG